MPAVPAIFCLCLLCPWGTTAAAAPAAQPPPAGSLYGLFLCQGGRHLLPAAAPSAPRSSAASQLAPTAPRPGPLGPAGPAAAPVCDLLLKLYPLRQPLLSRHATEALTALAAAPGGHLTARGLGELVGAVLGAEQLWERRADSGAVAAAVRLVEDGMCRLAALDARAAAQRLPRVFHTLVPQLASEHGSVRYAAGCCLKNLIVECVDDDAVGAALAGGGGGGAPPPLLSVLASLEGSLGAHYQEAWDSCLPGGIYRLEKAASPPAPRRMDARTALVRGDAPSLPPAGPLPPVVPLPT